MKIKNKKRIIELAKRFREDPLDVLESFKKYEALDRTYKKCKKMFVDKVLYNNKTDNVYMCTNLTTSDGLGISLSVLQKRPGNYTHVNYMNMDVSEAIKGVKLKSLIIIKNVSLDNLNYLLSKESNWYYKKRLELFRKKHRTMKDPMFCEFDEPLHRKVMQRLRKELGLQGKWKVDK